MSNCREFCYIFALNTHWAKLFNYMEHFLDKVSVQHMKAAAVFIESHGVCKNNEWNEYFIEVNNRFYPFKYLVTKAYELATSQEMATGFHSNVSNRNKIRDLGYNIKYIKGGIKYSELNVHKPVKNKLARVTWNVYKWNTPSGREGKSRTESYESSNGFGHEEWNFNQKYQIGEYKYGFLEPVHKFRDKYSGEVYNISLYTRNGTDKNVFWITTLRYVEILGKEEARWVLKEYEKRGWLDEMKNDLNNKQLDGSKLDEWIRDEFPLFNIKFKASQLSQLKEPILINDIYSIPSYRYILLNIPETLPEKIEKRYKEHGTFENSGSTNCNTSPTKFYRNYQSQEKKEIEIRHGLIQMEFMRFLQGKYGTDNVKRECLGYGMSRIDIVRKSSKGKIYYEVKSYNDLQTSLRLGIGQLLEYCLYPNVEKAYELVLVSDINPISNKDLVNYINHIRDFLKIPFSYICFDPVKKKVLYSTMEDEECES